MEGQDRQRTQGDQSAGTVTVVQERDDNDSCDLSGGSGCREKVAHLSYLESRMDKIR